MKKLKNKSSVPPGIEAAREWMWLRVGLMCSILVGLGPFIMRLERARNDLFTSEKFRREDTGVLAVRKFLREDAQMVEFPELTRGIFLGFVLVGVCLLGLLLWHYMTYRQGSMRIYLMRRLPDRTLIHRQCWTVPLLGLVLCTVTALLLLGGCYLIYLYRTPEVCLPAGYRRF